MLESSESQLSPQHDVMVRSSVGGRLAALAFGAELKCRPDLEATADPVALCAFAGERETAIGRQ